METDRYRLVGHRTFFFIGREQDDVVCGLALGTRMQLERLARDTRAFFRLPFA